MQEIQFDYFRGMEAEQYSFYRVPKVLFTAECFKSLSCEAKVLYGLMLDRMSLSIKNRWFDEEDRVYIIFYCGRNHGTFGLRASESDKKYCRTGLGKGDRPDREKSGLALGSPT